MWRQLCWAHLKRNFQALSERRMRAGPVEAWGLREIKRFFAVWRCYQASQITWAEMSWELVPVRNRLVNCCAGEPRVATPRPKPCAAIS